MNNPLVTVYVTNYNYADYLERCIESIFAQTYDNFELLVFDDGSTDESIEILSSLEKNYGFDLFLNSNIGLNRTANLALKKAKGKYIVRLDADDTFLKHAIGSLVHLMESKGLDLCSGDYNTIGVKEEFLQEIRRSQNINQRGLRDEPTHGACTMVRVSSLKNAGGYYDNVRCQDGYDLWLKLGLHGKYYHLSEPLFNYRIHSFSLSSNVNKILDCRYKIKKRYFDENCSENCKVYDLIIPINKNVLNSHIRKKIAVLLKSLEQIKYIRKVRLIASKRDAFSLKEIKANFSIDVLNRPDDSYRVKLFDLLTDVIGKEEIGGDYILVLDPKTKYDFERLVYEAIYTREIFDLSGLVTVRKDTRTFYEYGINGLLPRNFRAKIHWEGDELYSAESGIYAFSRNRLFDGDSDNYLGSRVGKVMVESF